MADLQITIDDGPGPVDVLHQLLSELERRAVRAVFFVLGEEVHSLPDAAGLIKTRGHVLGNHSWDHFIDEKRHREHTSDFSDDEIYSQFVRTHDEVRRVTGVTMRHWRAPRLERIGDISALIVQRSRSGARAPLYTLSHCDVHADSKDSQGAKTPAEMLRHLRADIQGSRGRKIFRLLFHVNRYTGNAFAGVLGGLVADGHRLVDFEQHD